MSDADDGAGEAQTSIEGTIFDQPPGTDWLLGHFIRLADGYGLEIGVTFHVEGMVVTGTLISGRTYFEELGAALSGGTGNTKMAQILGEGMVGFKDIYPLAAGEEEYPYRHAKFVHLREARVVDGQGGRLPSKGGLLWRGKCSAVSGFTIAQLVT